jgi:hypothetical protein
MAPLPTTIDPATRAARSIDDAGAGEGEDDAGDAAADARAAGAEDGASALGATSPEGARSHPTSVKKQRNERRHSADVRFTRRSVARYAGVHAMTKGIAEPQAVFAPE